MTKRSAEILRFLSAAYATRVLQQQEPESATDLSLHELRKIETASSTSEMTMKLDNSFSLNHIKCK